MIYLPGEILARGCCNKANPGGIDTEKRGGLFHQGWHDEITLSSKGDQHLLLRLSFPSALLSSVCLIWVGPFVPFFVLYSPRNVPPDLVLRVTPDLTRKFFLNCTKFVKVEIVFWIFLLNCSALASAFLPN